MAKTRIKTTPTRLQKDALMASAATTVTVTVAAVEDIKKRLRPPTAPTKEQLNATSTIIVPAPKRTNSICSATSTISHTSDTPSMQSGNESPTPATIPAETLSNPVQKTLNGLLNKPTTTPHTHASLKNRKVYMITEKCDDTTGNESSSHAATTGQKRKMYLIMEENTNVQNGDNDCDDTDPQKCLKMENGVVSNPTKKLTLYADKSDGELTQNFEKILPQILNRIQGKVIVPVNAITAPKQPNGATKMTPKAEPEDNRRLPITLPPKKNRTKIITYAANHNSNNNNIHNNNGNGIYCHAQIKQTSAATPVIVSAGSLNSQNSKKQNGHNSPHAASALTPPSHQPVPQKNINLSTDFLFLMKMLPKLESIPEPHKNHVKDCIEKIVMQNASLFEK